MADQMDDQDDELSRLIKDRATRFRAGPALESSISAEIALLSAAARPKPAATGWQWPRGWLAGAGFACGLAFSMVFFHFHEDTDRTKKLEEELVGSHVRALMVNHMTDVASSDQHTVKPWFQGKLSYSPPVMDLATAGFPLVGGRLDFIAGQPVAAMIYRHGGHLINLFVWPDTTEQTRISGSRQGYHVVRWARSGMAYSAVSDINGPELEHFATLLTP